MHINTNMGWLIDFLLWLFGAIFGSGFVVIVFVVRVPERSSSFPLSKIQKRKKRDTVPVSDDATPVIKTENAKTQSSSGRTHKNGAGISQSKAESQKKFPPIGGGGILRNRMMIHVV